MSDDDSTLDRRERADEDNVEELLHRLLAAMENENAHHGDAPWGYMYNTIVEELEELREATNDQSKPIQQRIPW